MKQHSPHEAIQNTILGPNNDSFCTDNHDQQAETHEKEEIQWPVQPPRIVSVPIFSPRGMGANSVVIMGDIHKHIHNDDSPNNIPSLSRQYSVEEKHNYNIPLKFLFQIVFTVVPILIIIFGIYDRIVLIIGIMIGVINGLYFGVFYYTIFSASKLYRLRSNIVRLKGFSNVAITNGIIEFPTIALTSISELGAITGSFWNVTSIANCGASYCCTLILFFITWDDIDQLYKNENGKGGGITGAILILCGTYGVSMLAAFPLYTKSSMHMCMHYLGFCIMTMGIFGFGIQQNWSLFCIVLIVIYFTSVIAWVICAWGFVKCLPLESTNSKEIHKTALVCLLIENNVLLVTTCALVGYVLTLDQLLQ